MEDYTRLLTEQLDQIDDLIVKAEKRLKDASDVKCIHSAPRHVRAVGVAADMR